MPDGRSHDAVRALRFVGERRKRVLDPVERFSEVTFGLIMVLTITSAVSVAESGREDLRQMLVAALGCNVAWGLVDGAMYVVTSIADRARVTLLLRGVKSAPADDARAIVLGALSSELATVFDPADVDRMVARLRALPERSRRSPVTGDDLRGALGSCLLVFLATLPPTLPYVLFQDVGRAHAISEAVAVVCLFLAGYGLGSKTGVNAWVLGLSMVALGTALVGLTVALGG